MERGALVERLSGCGSGGGVARCLGFFPAVTVGLVRIHLYRLLYNA